MPTEEIIVIEKTPEQLAEEAAILAHVITDPQAWIDNAIANNLEWAIQEKIEKYRQDYLNAKYLSITVDEETGEETRVENPDYLNRAQRDALEELKRDPLYGKNLLETAAIIKARINADCQRIILARFSLIHQTNVNAGIYADLGSKQWIVYMVKESDRCTNMMEHWETLDDVHPIVPVWPEYVEVPDEI